MAYREFVSLVHKSTKRDYVARVTQRDRADVADMVSIRCGPRVSRLRPEYESFLRTAGKRRTRMLAPAAV